MQELIATLLLSSCFKLLSYKTIATTIIQHRNLVVARDRWQGWTGEALSGQVDPGDCSYPRIQQSKARGILKSSRGYGCWENGPSEKRKGPRSKQSPYGNKTMKEMVKVIKKRRKVFSGMEGGGRGNIYLEAMLSTSSGYGKKNCKTATQISSFSFSVILIPYP